MWRKIKAQLNRKMLIALIPTFIFLWFVIFMMIQTFTGTVKESVTDTELSAASLTELSDSFEDTLQENIYAKNNYVNLNGLTTRALGINSLNDCQKLLNGYLTFFEESQDIEYATDHLIELDNFLANREIDFLYILAPSKLSFYNTEFAPGYNSEAWENIDIVIDALNDANVSNLDVDDWFEKNKWSMEDVFFKTDHHWLPEAALQTARLTMELLSQDSLVEYNEEILEDTSWTVTNYKDFYLGYHGKSTGIFYSGLDDISIYIPNFKTEYSYSYLKNGTTNWTYTNTILQTENLEQNNYFTDNVYDTYMGGDYPLHKTLNSQAINKERVLLIGDSYKRPLEYFLSTQFQEIYTIDLRYYTDGTLAQFISEIQPELVIMCSYERLLGMKSLYSFGVSDYLSALEETDLKPAVLDLGNFSLSVDAESQNVFTVITANLDPGETYTLTLDSTFYSGGEDLYIQMTLQNTSTNKAVYNRYFDANSDEAQKWIFDVPEKDGTYAIYLYAGTKGQTGGVSVEVTGVDLFSGIIE